MYGFHHCFSPDAYHVCSDSERLAVPPLKQEGSQGRTFERTSCGSFRMWMCFSFFHPILLEGAPLARSVQKTKKSEGKREKKGNNRHATSIGVSRENKKIWYGKWEIAGYVGKSLKRRSSIFAHFRSFSMSLSCDRRVSLTGISR